MKWSRESYRSGQHALSRAELARVIQAAEEFEDVVLLKLAVASGLRRGDIVALRWDDLDFESGRLTFYEQKKRRTRSVYLPDGVLNDLRRWMRANRGEPYVFPGRSDEKYGKGHMSNRTAYNRLQKALKAAGLDERPFHALRATCIKLAQQEGWTVTQAAEHVGDSIRVIEQHYMAPSDGEMRETARGRPIV